VGGRALGVTVLLYPSVPLARIIGSDIAHAAPLTLVAGVGHWIAGTVNGTILLSLLVGSPLGVIAGSRAVGWVPERGLRLTLATVLTNRRGQAGALKRAQKQSGLSADPTGARRPLPCPRAHGPQGLGKKRDRRVHAGVRAPSTSSPVTPGLSSCPGGVVRR